MRPLTARLQNGFYPWNSKLFVHSLYSYLKSRKAIKSMLYLFIFGNFPNPRGLGCARTLRYAWLYPRQSQASLGGYYGGNPRTSPKIANVFSKYFSLAPKLLVSLEETNARRKQLRYGAGRVVGPPTPPGYGTPLTTPRLRCL